MIFPLKEILQKIGRLPWFYIGICLTLAFLPFSKFMVTSFEFLMGVGWLFGERIINKWNRLKHCNSFWIFFIIYFVHIIGMFYSDNLSYAIKDLRIKLPMLVFPIMIASAPSFTQKQLKFLMIAFSFAVLVSTLICATVFFGLTPYHYTDNKQISIFQSHVRFALLINISLFALLYYAYKNTIRFFKHERITYILVSVWFIFFLIILRSITGVVVLFLIGLVFFVLFLLSQPNKLIRRIFIFMAIFIPILIAVYLVKVIEKFYTIDASSYQNLQTHTANGNLYSHNTAEVTLENGRYAYTYICEEELAQEWNKRSPYQYDGLDIRKQPLKYTLFRYMTSKGLRKDSAGFSKMTEKDIQNVEKGLSNHIFENKYSLYPVVYQTIWQIDVYLKGGNPSAHSITQRIEFAKAGFNIFKNNPIFGVGTGDVADEFKKYYESTNSRLDVNHRLRSHNQYLTFLLTFGIVGFCAILFGLFAPPWIEKKYSDILFVTTILIALISFINEDTLESQVGVTFFALFYSIFVWCFKKEPEQISNPS